MIAVADAVERFYKIVPWPLVVVGGDEFPLIPEVAE
jgi:hypothetical protein